MWSEKILVCTGLENRGILHSITKKILLNSGVFGHVVPLGKLAGANLVHVQGIILKKKYILIERSFSKRK